LSLPSNRIVTGDCGHSFPAQVWDSINTSDSELVEKFRLGVLNLVKCPACGEETDVRAPFLYHDVARRLMIFIYDPDLDDDPVPTLNPGLLQAYTVTGVEVISADSFESARRTICELDQTLSTMPHSQNPSLTEARIYAGMFKLKFAEAQSRQMATYNEALRALEELEQSEALEPGHEELHDQGSQNQATVANPDRDRINTVLHGCDFQVAKNELANCFAILNNEARVEGGSYWYSEKMAEALHNFVTNPCAETAAALLDEAPMLSTYFEQSKAGGTWKGYSGLLGNQDVVQKPIDTFATAFRDSMQPSAPAPPVWWLAPLLGLAFSLLVGIWNTTLAALLAGLMIIVLVGGAYRARRNRRL
jgi:CpXC protein